MSWEVEFTDEFRTWWYTLTDDEQETITASVARLEEYGPALGRPDVDTLAGTKKTHHLKELRPTSTTIRILFAFDPRRMAILLIGGNKAGEWNKWYERMIPLAERLYQEHLESLREEGLI